VDACARASEICRALARRGSQSRRQSDAVRGARLHFVAPDGHTSSSGARTTHARAGCELADVVHLASFFVTSSTPREPAACARAPSEPSRAATSRIDISCRARFPTILKRRARPLADRRPRHPVDRGADATRAIATDWVRPRSVQRADDVSKPCRHAGTSDQAQFPSSWPS